MHVTPAAISQQLSKLEQLLGVALFVRSARKLSLSEAGMSYFLGIRPAFRQIEEATARLGDDHGGAGHYTELHGRVCDAVSASALAAFPCRGIRVLMSASVLRIA